LFGYAHVPHMIPRQRRIDGSDLPDQRGRFRMAAMGARQLIDAGYQAVGFDHFALPGDGLARAALSGTLRRNFQGFTDDPSSVLLGFGASAISELPGLMVQNEKNPGRYRMLIGADCLAGRRGEERRWLLRVRPGGRCVPRREGGSEGPGHEDRFPASERSWGVLIGRRRLRKVSRG